MGALLETLPFVAEVRPVQTNIVIFDVTPPHTAASLLQQLAERGVLASPFGPQTVRFVTHLEVTPTMVGRVMDVLKEIAQTV
jgi:threonine aldolase